MFLFFSPLARVKIEGTLKQLSSLGPSVINERSIDENNRRMLCKTTEAERIRRQSETDKDRFFDLTPNTFEMQLPAATDVTEHHGFITQMVYL